MMRYVSGERPLDRGTSLALPRRIVSALTEDRVAQQQRSQDALSLAPSLPPPPRSKFWAVVAASGAVLGTLVAGAVPAFFAARQVIDQFWFSGPEACEASAYAYCYEPAYGAPRPLTARRKDEGEDVWLGYETRCDEAEGGHHVPMGLSLGFAAPAIAAFALQAGSLVKRAQVTESSTQRKKLLCAAAKTAVAGALVGPMIAISGIGAIGHLVTGEHGPDCWSTAPLEFETGLLAAVVPLVLDWLTIGVSSAVTSRVLKRPAPLVPDPAPLALPHDRDLAR